MSDSETTARTCPCFWLFSLRQIRDFSKKLVAYRRKFGVGRIVQLLEASGQSASLQNIYTPQANWARHTFLNWVISFVWDFAKYATVKVSDGLKNYFKSKHIVNPERLQWCSAVLHQDLQCHLVFEHIACAHCSVHAGTPHRAEQHCLESLNLGLSLLWAMNCGILTALAKCSLLKKCQSWTVENNDV